MKAQPGSPAAPRLTGGGDRRLRWGGAALLVCGVVLLGRLGPLGVRQEAFLGALTLASLGYLFALASLRSARWDGGRDRLAAILLVAFLVRAAVLPVPASDDVHRYLWEGKLQSHGANPFAVSPLEARERWPELAARDPHLPHVNHPQLTTIYPPFAQLCFSPFARVSADALAWKVAMVAVETLLLLVLGLCLRANRRPLEFLIAYAWHPLPVLAFAAEGHVDALLLLFVMLALLLLDAGRRMAAGGVWALAVASKFLPALLLPLLIRPLGPRGLLVAFATLGVVTTPYLDAGWGLVRTLAHFGWGMGHDSLLGTWLEPILGGGVLRAVLAVAWAAAAIRVLRRRPGPWEGAFGLLALFLVFSPTVHPWYFTWLVPFFALGGNGAGGRPQGEVDADRRCRNEATGRTLVCSLAGQGAWVALTLTAPIAYLAYGFREATGDFGLPRAWVAAQYAPFLVLLVWRGRAARARP